MKKFMGLFLALGCVLGMVGCNGQTVNIDFPFEVEDVENIEMYHFEEVHASAKMKVVFAESDIKTLYDFFKDLQLEDKQTEEITGADVTRFRFNLSDGTSYETVLWRKGNEKILVESSFILHYSELDLLST